jgi:hypothetical protein
LPTTTAATVLARAAMGAAVMAPATVETIAASTIETAARKDSDWYANHGGYRTYVDESDKVVDREDAGERGILFVMTLQRPDGSGDGTVADSSSSALNAKATVRIGEEESWFERGHEAIYRSESAQYVTFSAIENLCLKRIKEVAG